MLIGNLPIASNAPAAVYLENRQRAGEFRLLESALRDGDVPGATHALELLRQNAPNSLKSAQKLRDFGHGTNAGNEFEMLENALKQGDLEEARRVLGICKREGEPGKNRDQTPPQKDERTEPPVVTPSSSSIHDVGASLDTLA